MTTSRLLLVDDEEDILLLLRGVLGNEYQLETATDGEQAWQLLHDGDGRGFDLVICDLGMPRVPGSELVERMRQDQRFATTPVILLTGNDSKEARLNMLEVGVSDYVLKPFPPNELRLRVRNILRTANLMRELEESRHEAENANRELREVNAELDRFAAAAAHDIQAPLANIAGYAHLLSEGVVEDPTKARSLLSSIGENADRAITLVRELLSHARTVASSDEVDVIDLNGLLDQVLQHLESAITESGAHIDVTGDLGLVSGRRVALESALLNLVSNAVKYRHPDRPAQITVSSRSGADPAFVELVIRDNGRGIDAADRERVFALGARGREEGTGTGIGLATVRAVVNRHGGRIWLEDSPPPGGLTVRCTLPAA